MRLVLLLLLAISASTFAPTLGWAQRTVSVATMEQFIRSSLQLKQSDKQVADVVKTMRLTERMEPSAIENLQGLGAGPRTLEALRTLATAAAKLPPATAATPIAATMAIPAPSDAEQRALLEEVTTNALQYTSSLPNFTCTQVTRRQINPGDGVWHLDDIIQEQLSFVDGKENYKVVAVNNLVVNNISHEQLGGTTSSGEFGTMLFQIFNPKTGARIQWERWGTLRGRRMHVFEFRILQRDSEYSVLHGASGRSGTFGYHGLVYADAESKMVMRIKLDLDGLEAFPINAISLDLNYDFTDIGGRPFVVPLKAELTSLSGRYATRNEVEFRRYSRFTADATIIYDVPDELPDSVTEETPAK
jgi:hypothetical protein